MSQRAPYLSKAATCLYGTLLVLAAVPSQAGVQPSDGPLFLTVTVPPNLVLTIDDSGSMRRAFVPENCLADTSDCNHLDNRYEKAANRNLIHYNPEVTYPAPKTADGTSLTTSFTSAYKNGFDTGFGTVNLSTSYRPTANLDLNGGVATEAFMGHYASDVRCKSTTPRFCEIRQANGSWLTTATSCPSTSSTAATRDASCRGLQGSGFNPAPLPAYYYVFDSTNTNCSGAEADNTDNDCYDIKIVSATSGPGGTDERQNFANWYSFARTRNLATQTATSLAMSTVPSTVRVAWQALNSCRGSTTSLVDSDCDGWKNNFIGMSNAIKPFTGTHKSNFYSWIFQQPTNGGTPLPEAMKRAGDYYRTSGENSPYDNNFSTSNSGELSCRRNYHVMFTDGIWTTAASVGNSDNTTTALPNGSPIAQYTPTAPFKDGTSNTLADVAFKYWAEDSRSTLDNDLSASIKDQTGTPAQQFNNPVNDPAVWQHMVNFTIGLGLTGYLADAGLTWTGNMYGGSYPALKAGTKSWPAANTNANNAGNVADLWHAAINSRGQFFSADSPASLAAAFQASINAITGGAGSNAALASNSTSLNLNNTVIYQAKFDQDWSGTLVAFAISSTGAVGEQKWDANKLIPAPASRKIFTYDNSAKKGVTFDSCSSLSTAQRDALDTNISGMDDDLCEARLQWLRGDTSKELRNNGTFRNRNNGVMGDILSSNPAYVKDIDYGYSSMSGYAAFLSSNASRTAMVYVGSNDGKLYGIDATTGVEKFSYVPGSIYGNLSALTDPNYVHKYFVDGPVSVGDAYLRGEWRTILLGGLNNGGRSIYALDVTDPNNFGIGNVKWEYPDPTATPADPDLGLTYSQPQIGVLESGQWVAVFGNGYNSTSGGAYLYIVNLDTGELIKKITASDDTSKDESNGLSTPALYDADGDRLIDAIYAGDLLGNLWKFDVSGTSSATWDVAFSKAPLFRAGQPITAQPTVLAHPQPTATLVVFGTGQYLNANDLNTTAVQSIYGLRDSGSAITGGRSDLQEQTFDAEGQVGTRNVRRATRRPIDYTTQKGYFIDLEHPSTSGGVAERVTSPILVKGGKLIAISIVPNTDDPCSPGGTSYLTELSASDGGGLGYNALDLNSDGKFDAEDKFGEDYASSVELTGIGLSNTVLYLQGDSLDVKVYTGTENAIGTLGNCKIGENCGTTPPAPGGAVKRRSWIQIR